MRDATSNKIPVAGFNPLLSDELLTKYRGLASTIEDPRTQDAYKTCLGCAETWWGLPESTRTDGTRWLIGVPKRDAKGEVVKDDGGAPIYEQVEYQEVPLEVSHVEALDAVTPWLDELNLVDAMFLTLQGPVRDAAFHLLWYAKELSLGREPLTKDKL